MGAIDIIKEAEYNLGSPYVYGTWGQLCTPSLRKRYARYNPSQEKITFSRCQVLRNNNPKPSCSGCKYEGMLAFDCRGFTHYCVEHGAGIDITGGYVGRQWSDPNWDVKGTVNNMLEAVSCLFLDDMSHTGLYILNGQVIHCSGEAKRDTLTGGRKWAKFGIPKGLYSWTELAKLVKGEFDRMLKKGMSGDDVRDMQILLNSLGYDCGTADGKYGNKTEAAVKAFQENNGLLADGIAGPQTLDAIKKAADINNTDNTEFPELPEQPDDPVSEPEQIVDEEIINELIDIKIRLDKLIDRLGGYVG